MNPSAALERLLSCVERIHNPAPGRWTGCCPAHEDRSPSLSISDVDGTILVHCHAGCSFADIAAAVGLEPSDFFPPRAESKPLAKSQRWVPAQVLAVIHDEALVVLLAAESIDLPAGVDRDRLHTAVVRIREAIQAGGFDRPPTFRRRA